MISNSEQKQRNAENLHDQIPGDGQLAPIQSFDKRPPQPLMANGMGGPLGQSQDLKNKENMT